MTNATLPATDTIDARQLRELMREDPALRILDVRTGGEFDSVHIPGAYNVPLDTLAEHVADLADVDHPVVLVCKSGARAGQAHSKLTGAGKQHLHLLDGGMDAWESTGGDVVRSNSTKWAMDRQVRFVAGSISLVGILVSIFVPKAKWLAGGVAAGLTFSAVTNTCAMGNALAKLPYNKSNNCDIDGVLDQLRKAA
ncbi:MAG: rhodanese-like domain-containing protein [Ilumatobacter sp.]|jgi:rhodanese-related sulfurtransferase|uniref:rhodanese-like domain-containing protein n=1 Tax=Ilumatobacter sp. TaxID=1967498 RepID=UPI00391AA205